MTFGEIKEADLHPRKLDKVAPGDEIVISGIAGRFPESDSVKQLQENLMNKKDLITGDDRRWKLEHPDIPKRTGKISNIEKFDALFFGVHFKQAHTMDPVCRMILEHAFEAILDAGVNPKQLRGTRTGVFVGASFSESEKTWFYEKLQQASGFGISGCSRAMLANRISYYLGVTGPSYAVDTACSSSLYALEHAYRAIRDGQCDAAIVGSGNLCLHPYVSMQFYKLGVTSMDGRSKAFDDSANGYVRSEAVCVVFLQRAKDARRVYATMVHGKLNCDGFKEEGVTFPSSYMQSVLMKEFYMEIGLPPTIVNYMEAHGTGTRVGDPEELNAIDAVFCPGRTTPLRIGSGKSNYGHSEPASGICSVAKVVIAMESGVIPPNLHYKSPREGARGLEQGRLKVVTEPTPLDSEYVGINSFGFGGANAHVLLKTHPKEKLNDAVPIDDLPRLVAISGRTEEAVLTMIDDLNSRPVDVEHVALLHNIHSDDISGHLCRGYTVLPARGTAKAPVKEIQSFPGTKRPVWFIFPGMGAQWPAMGEALLRIPIFAESIRKSDAVLRVHGFDLLNVITNPDKTVVDDVINGFAGIAAIQIALVDVLKSLGIEPDNIVGHSLGELASSYADGSLTAEQTILSAYFRGRASAESNLIPGAMAAVGLGYKQIKDICPPDIEIACHNSAESVTVSGPIKSMEKFVAELQSKNIFAREVRSSNMAYHSSYIAGMGPRLLGYMKKIIPNPLPRSSKWISTSVPMEKWNTETDRWSSAEYHTNNVLKPVLLEEALAFVPKDAVTIEIAPHGLLQAILKRALPPSVTNVALTQRGHKDNVEVFLQALGKLFNAGLHPQLAKLYPPVEFPVSRGTPMISHLIKWEHSDDWYVTSYESQGKVASGERIVKVALTDSEYEHLTGHVIDGRVLYPATGYITLVWETIGMMRGELYTDVSVVFEDIKFLRATTFPKDGAVELTVVVQKGTGRFEIVEGDTAVVTGLVRACSTPGAEKMNLPPPQNNDAESMSTRDFYKELRLRGYHYNGIFRSVKSSTTDGLKGHIVWRNDWVSFMDNMLQMHILHVDTRGLFVPTSIKKLVIDAKEHRSHFKPGETDKDFPVYVDNLFNVITCGGVEIRGLKASAIARRKPVGEPVLEEYKFVAHSDGAEMELRDIARLVTNLALENQIGIKVKTLELLDDADSVPFERLLSPLFAEALGDIPLIQVDANIVSNKSHLEGASLPANVAMLDPKKVTKDANALVAVGHGLFLDDRKNNLNLLLQGLAEGGFLLSRESNGGSSNDNVEAAARANRLRVVLKKTSGKETLFLLRKLENVPDIVSVVHVDNGNFDWVDKMRRVLSKEVEKKSGATSRVLFVGEGDFENGLLGFINCLRKEPGGEIARGLLIQDPKAPKFSLSDPVYAKILQKDLAVSVLRENGVWGTYRHLPLPSLEPKSVRHALVKQMVRGDLSSLTWTEGPIQLGQNHKDLVHIVYSSMNFKDIMLATGKLAAEVVAETRQAQDCVLGFEYSGIHHSGKRIMGLIDSRAMTNLCIGDPDLAWEIPKNWTLEDAATVPCVYATCYYAFYKYGKIKKGDKILIHAGTGGVGQAAINLALYEGCEVFTTVGTPEKRQFIRENFPQIPDSHIGNSRDTSFERMIMKQTNGRGVDMVLNSLAEEKLLASVRCLAWGGRFLEIGKFDLTSDNPLGMECFLRGISFNGIHVDHVIGASRDEKMELSQLVGLGLKNGAVKPFVRTVFQKDQVEAAFRFMASGKHIGKVLIKVRDENEPLNSTMLAMPRYHCFEDRSYVLLGGLGGFGLELADWLVLRGAKNLVITSRTGLKNGYQKMRVRLWQDYGVRVVIIAGKDPSKRDDCQSILEAATKLAPIDGIFNLAVVLSDAVWDNQTRESFEESFKTKAWATKHLDALTRKMCPKLRHFVVFSSVACGRGNAGQTNYGMANSVMERICERRVAEGFPALAVEWGAIGDVGLVAEMHEDHKELVIGGTLQQRITSCLHELDGFMQQSRPIVSSMVVAEKRAGTADSTNVVDMVLNIMGLKDLKGVSPTTSLAELGMDSMMSVEIKQTLEREFEIFLTAQDIRGLNFNILKELSEKDAGGGAKAIQELGSSAESDVVSGLGLLVRTLGKKDLSHETCFKLQSKHEANREEIFLLPGIEGMGSVFANIARHIKAPASCLQLNIKSSSRSIADMVDELLPHILKKNKNRRQYTIVGYSYGAVIGIELARKLENDGKEARLILIDGAPELLKNIISQNFSSSTEEGLQNEVLLGIVNLLIPHSTAEVAAELRKCSKWEDKLNAMISRLPFTEEDTLPVEDQRAVTTAIYNRLLAAQKHDISQLPRIKAPIVLLKPIAPTVRMPEEDYGLSKVTSSKVEVYSVEGNHITMLDNEKVAAAINGDNIEDVASFRKEIMG